MRPFLWMMLLFQSPSVDQRMAYVLSQLEENGFSRQEAEAFFQDSRLKIYPPREVAPRKIDWDRIIAQLVQRTSVREGQEFLSRHAAALQGAETESGVPKEVLVAIFRLESNFGRNSGNYGVFNVFYSFLVNSEEERRWRWAADNLVSLAAYCRATESDCFRLQGSYAGAMGPAQFLPRSLELYGRDGNGDRVVNPFEMADAIFSAANFLAQHGWRQDQTAALGKYYGSSNGYPRAIFAYAETLQPKQPDSAPSCF
ncbi:MAG: lytic murein transglycosylase [Acidobacteria bacterium]|nr:lytic murein transglycosylase [Acidobacteriota bacterium]